MNIHEYQAKKVFSDFSIPINPGSVVKSPEDALESAKKLSADGSFFAVKAQVHAGGRGKGGGVKIVKTP